MVKIDSVGSVFNLLTAPWLPVRRQSGSDVVAPWQLTEFLDTDPILALDWPRADFQVATMEFLVGLLTTTCPPARERDWLDGWDIPPEPAVLEAAFAPYTHAFDLDGPGPRFMQDFEDLVSPTEPIERLLIEAPGASTTGRNTDLLVHRNQVATLGRPAAAIALYTFQAWAPAGGAGNRTGLRGGGPLTTLVLPGARQTLFHMIWANVPQGKPPEPADLPRVFPWLAPTIGSSTGRIVTPDTAHPLLAWWGMPRRIRLNIQPCDPAQPCGLTGQPDSMQITGWRQRPHGANYEKWGGAHALTPHYRLKPNSELLALHPQPGGIGYRHWLGLVVSDVEGLRVPAGLIGTWRSGRDLDTRGDDPAHGREDRFLAAGFDMDNMKARGFVESEMPLPAVSDAKTRVRVDELARALIKAADQVANLLRRAVRDALFGPGATVKLDWELLSAVREQVWEQTETAFHDALAREARRTDADPLGPERAAWLRRLRTTALALFDVTAPLDADGGTLPKSDEAIRRLLRARRNLAFALTGYGTDGADLFVKLSLPPAETKPAKTKPARKARAP